jgi:NADPH:quinone reductase-like Zn-dependent oxidoreductase
MALPVNSGLFAGRAGEVDLRALPMPGEPGPDGLVVRMLFAPVNPADNLLIDQNYALTVDAAAPLGAEGVGVVERVGSRVTDLGPGDLVLPLDRGNWTGWRLVERARVLAVPAGFDLHQAAMMRINPATAWLLLQASGAVAGDCIVQNGASSAVARWVRLLAAGRDLAVVDVVRRATLASLPRAVDDGEGLVGAVRSAAGGRPIRAAFDCVAGEATGRLAACLDEQATLLLFGHLSGRPCSVRSQLVTGGRLTIRGFSLRPAEAAMAPAEHADMVAALWAAAQQDGARLPVRAILPLSEARHAIALARTPGRGRVLLDLATISGM